MNIEIMNKQKKQTETRVLYRALAIGALVWGAIYLAIATGEPWLLVPVIGIYSLMFLAPLEGVYEWIWRRIRKLAAMLGKPLPNPLQDQHRASPPHLSFPTGSPGTENGKWQEKDQAAVKTSRKTAA